MAYDLLSEATPRVVFIGSGTRGPFTFADNGTPIRVRDSSFLVVRRYASTTDETGTLLALNTDYTVNNTDVDNVTVTLTAAQAVLSSTQRLVVERTQPIAGVIEYATGGNFNGPSLSDAVSILSEQVQELRKDVDRSLKVDWRETSERAVPIAPTDAPKAIGRSTDGSFVHLTAADLDVDVILGAGWAPQLASTFALQPLDGDTTAIAALASTGFPTRTGSNTWAQRTFTAGRGMVITNANGVSGNPTIAMRADVLNLRDYGALGDGSDDTDAIEAWLAAITPNTIGYAPGGNYYFSRALSKTMAGLAIVGDGPFQTIFTYTGANTTNDIITFGNGSTAMSLCYLHNFKVMSTTTMTGGNGLRLRRFQRSTVNGITIDGQDGNGKLYHGIYFDEIDNVDFIDFDIRAAQDGLRTRGTLAGGAAGLMLFAGKILQCNVGFRVGGGMGGIYGDQVDIILNNTNMIIDTTLQATANREVILGSSFALDTSNTGANIQISDTLATGASLLHLSGTWCASSAQDGILIDANVNFLVICQGGTFFNNTRDGVRNNSTTSTIVYAPSRVTNQGGYGINSTVANANIYVDGSAGYWAANTLGNANSNVVIAQLIGQNGAISFGASPRPAANDGAALGVSGTAWADLFLASGGVINWNAGDVTLTHSANQLAFAGASTGYTFDSMITTTVAGAALGHEIRAPGGAYFQWNDTTAGSGLKFMRVRNTAGFLTFEKVNDAYDTSTTLATLDVNGNFDATGVYKVDAVQVVSNRVTGFTQMTGTALKTALASYGAGTASAGYVQAELQAVMNALQSVSQRLKAHEDSMFTHGLIGA